MPAMACGFESRHRHQLRNSHHRSVSGFAENCTLVGISSLPTATQSSPARQRRTASLPGGRSRRWRHLLGSRLGGLSSGIFFVNARQKKSGPFLASISHKISHGFCASLYGSCSFILLSWHGRYQKGADPQKQGPRFHFITKSGSYCARSSSRQSPQAPFAS